MKKFTTLFYIVALVLGFGLFINSCEDNSPSPAKFLSFDGNVIDSKGSPLEGVIVKALNSEKVYSIDTTDAMGLYVISNIPESDKDVRIIASLDGYGTFESTLKDFQNQKLNGKYPILLDKKDTCCNVVKVVVKDDETGEVIQGAQVKLAQSGEWKIIKESDSLGTAVFTQICDGKYWIRVAKNGYQVVEDDFELDSCETKVFEVKLKANKEEQCCAKVKLTVKNAEGNVISGAEVKIKKVDGDFYSVKSTNESGYVEFNERCKGKYYLRISKNGYKVYESDYFELDSCWEKTLEIKLTPNEEQQCCAKVKLTVKNADGGVIQGAEVKIKKVDGDFYSVKSSNENGYVEFNELCKGKYYIRISKSGFKVYESDYFLLDSCWEKTLEIKLTPNEEQQCCAKVKLTVKNAEGNAVAGAEVKIRMVGSDFYSVKTTNESGYVEFTELCKGNYNIRIAKSGYKVYETDNFLMDSCWVKTLELKLTANEESCCGLLKIKVVDKSTGNPIYNTEVKLMLGNTIIGKKYTGQDGYVQFGELCEGSYWLRFAKDQYKVIEDDLKMAKCDTISLDVKMEKNAQDTCCNNKLKLHVMDIVTKEYIKNATVKLWRNGAVYKTVTTESGALLIQELCTGKWGVSISHENYKSIEFEFEVNCDNLKEFEKFLTKKEQQDTCCGGKIKIWLKDEAGELIKGGKVRLWKNGSNIATKYSENGYVIFESLCKATYGVDILHELYKSKEFQVELGCNESKELTQVLTKNSDTCETAVIKVIAKDFDSKTPIAGAKVVIKKGDDIVAQGETSAEGYYYKQGLKAPATYKVIVTKDNYEDVVFELNFPYCKTLQETANMKKK